jgi:anti-anti-sigma factor
LTATGLSASPRPGPPGVYVLALAGHADLDTAPVLSRALDEALTGSPVPGSLVVDCAGLVFCSSSGLNELLYARRRAVDAGIAFRLAAPTRQVVRLLQITGTDTVFDVLPGAPVPGR